ncbi:putative clpA/ClpB, AAA lid domain-containing protein [Helianthus annuus]|uniref:ClpA/ClpB AAA lid domain-containing protein n=1 Tax=Helianthus annuus TaxID=4232 RepID=A0A251TCG5_HELAN|nr:chaperone protein ClpB1 isoform X1 [Helianthus annuus]KAF5783539.1 hypothetical protein HanXRQr2_Chr11g0509101 [Helianthus annuus]KAJ0518807.1 putative clpA/ClpB, AAA lid domain-containing protein [Helianthus annuus]KAJ0686829.1 putative clpA/ClpB, AAA lid domain-containing protein [Helianthus annuus]KAJ0690635.1 putative clpA/ClpB, AAA lid domain-containing protein [Helianthus annuus]KAJ0872238.1 putative clpA/ClpB, AAA lid domain-containing protein [Helianthus annuus]
MDTNNIMISLGLSVSDHNMFIVHRETTLAVSTLAIDLVDEACANVRVQLDSQKTEEIDNLERKRMQLEVELHALEKETDTASKVRLVEVKKELNDLRVITKEHADSR